MMLTDPQYPDEQTARLAMLSGVPVELVRFVVVAYEGEIRFAALANHIHANKPFMIAIAESAQRHFPKLRRYNEEGHVLFTIPVTVAQTDSGAWEWGADVTISRADAERDAGRIVRVARDICSEILPIISAAALAGEFP